MNLMSVTCCFMLMTSDAPYDYGLRRPLRYPLDYSSDTEAPYVGQLLPPEWRRPPTKPVGGSGRVKVEVEPMSFEPEWPPTVNGKRRRRGNEVDDETPILAAPTSSTYYHASTVEEPNGATKRHISDSDLNGAGGTFNEEGYLGLLLDYDVAARSRASNRLPAPITASSRRTANGSADKSNSLPEMENGNGSGNSSTKSDELRHWLRKLDKLSLELQEFNHRGGEAESTSHRQGLG
jgi:hypothetical protein